MHRVEAFRPIHRDHHKYKNIIVLPSNANAVSANEFTFAYMLPFVAGCVIIRPSYIGLLCATSIVSSFNLIVHSKFATSWKWPWFLVAPWEHLEHHKYKKRSYSTPTFSWDNILNAMGFGKKQTSEYKKIKQI